MKLEAERRIAVNIWVVKARWFYVFGVFVIGLMTKTLSNTNMNFSLSLMAAMMLAIFAVNILLLRYIKWIRDNESYKNLQVINFFQIAMELAITTLIIHNAGGIDSIAIVFYFLPIVGASLLFGTHGAIITAVASGFLLNALVLLEYYGIVPHVLRYNVETLEYQNLAIAVTKTLTLSMFYLIIGFFSGLGSKILRAREREYLKMAHEATEANKELDKKLKELANSEKSALQAFADLKQERIVSESEKRRTKAILSNLVDPIILIDGNNVLSFLNPAAYQVLGLTSSVLGKPISDQDNYSMKNFGTLVPLDYKVKTASELKIKEDNVEEITIKNKGQDVTYKVTTVAVYDDRGKALGVMKIFYNLTREKMLDKLKSEFISIAAHQLRTPLSAIKWAIKMVLDGDAGALNGEQQKILNKGYQSNERIIKLVNDMLDVSRIEEGRFNYEFDVSSLKEVIEMTMDNLRPRADERGIKIDVACPDNTPEIEMDKEKIMMVLQNLLENAIEYSPEQSTVRLQIEPGQRFIKFRVIDSGVGIPKLDRAKLFTKFYRADNVIRMQTDGSGLGLFIVNNIVKAHNGEITCSSEEGKGTEFVVTLPLVQP